MTGYDDDIKQAFVEESLEHLSTMENDLLEIERNGDAVEAETVNRVFRTAHSIKGGASFLGLSNIKSLAHDMENLLGLIRSRKMAVNAEVIHFLLQGADTLDDLIRHLDDSNDMEIEPILEALQGIAQASDAVTDTGSSELWPSEGHGDAEKTRNGDKGPPALEAMETDRSHSDRESVITRDRESEPPAGSTDSEALGGFSVDEALVEKTRSENRHLYVVEIPMSGDAQVNTKKQEMLLSEITAYGTVVDSRASENCQSKEGRESRSPCFLVLFASSLAVEELGLLFELPPDCITPALLEKAPDKTADAGNTPEDDACIAGRLQLETPDPSVKKPKTTPVGNRPPKTAPADPSPPDSPGETTKRSPSPMEKAPGEAMKETSIRVDLTLLDNLMTLAGELVLGRNQLLQLLSRSNPSPALQAVGQRIDLITSELQETVMLTRMQPIGRVFDRFPRLARDLSRSLGKKVKLVIRGRDVELDKTLLEAVTDPLTHLVRNAIDHGIETMEDRQNAGKETTGTIELHAFHEAGKVNIEVADDGRGLDTERLVKKALSASILTKDQADALSESEKNALMFMPGLSTRNEVTDLSGRGVGMDVVKSNMDRIGGQVSIETTPGHGCRFLIKVPLTLAIIPSQTVVVEAERFAIPQVNLVELVRIPAGQVKERVEYVGHDPVVRLRDELIPLVRLTDVLELERTYLCPETGRRRKDVRMNIGDRRSWRHPQPDRSDTSPEKNQLSDPVENGGKSGGAEYGGNDHRLNGSRPPEKGLQGDGRKDIRCTHEDRRWRVAGAMNITVVFTGTMKYGLIVDTLLDSEEIVVKPLGRHLQQCRAYAGATIMGDGRAALILDVANIADMGGMSPVDTALVAGRKADQMDDGEADGRHRRSLLLFRGAPSEQFALPLETVERIEKIQTEQIEHLGRMRVIQNRGKTLPLFSVDKIANVTPMSDADACLVIVTRAGKREVGLLATGPVDAVKVPGEMDTETLRQPGIAGSIPVGGITTQVVDVQAAVKSGAMDLQTAAPEMISAPEVGEGDAGPEMSARGEVLVSPEESPIILVVEDSGFFRNQIRRILETEGFTVMAAEDGQAALDLLDLHFRKLSLVVTDLEMPHMNGFELIQAIRSSSRYARLPVIALSTLADEGDVERAERLGVDDYHIKLDPDRLIRSIRSQMASRRAGG